MPTTFNPSITTKWGGLPKWVLFRAATYLGGEGVTFGPTIVPHMAKMFKTASIDVDVLLTPEVDFMNTDPGVFADNKLDHVFIGYRIELIDDPPKLIKDFARKLRPGGHLVVAVKVQNPAQVDPEYNFAPIRFRFNANDIDTMVADAGRWQAKDYYERDGVALRIYKKLIGGKNAVLPAKPRAKKRACIARYGALGDAIIITPLIHELHNEGYEVTMNISPYARPIFENNPYISNLVMQEKDMIPNLELGPYWDEWRGDYDKYINLSETLEGRFLKVEGRRDFYTPQSWRIKTGEHNYYDYTMHCGGFDSPGKRGELYFSPREEREATKFFSRFKNKFVIIWALNGSSHHKVYPGMVGVLEQWFLNHDDSYVITVGDQRAKTLFNYEHMKLIRKEGEWGLRESLIGSKYANLVVGPETMMTNAAGCFDTPKITLLSHSTHEALCKHWINDYCLEPNKELAPCYPCFQLHYSRESCPIKQMLDDTTQQVIAEAPACAMNSIEPERLLARIEEVYQKHFVPTKSLIVV